MSHVLCVVRNPDAGKPVTLGKVNGREVVFADGTIEEFENILLATGYRHWSEYSE